MSGGNGHDPDEVQRLALNGLLFENGHGAHAISRERWESWPNKLVSALQRAGGTWRDRDGNDDDNS